MSAEGYSAKLVFETRHFFTFLQLLQDANAANTYTVTLSHGIESVKIATDSEYFVANKEIYRLKSETTDIALQFPLPNQWVGNFDYGVTLKLPLDQAFQRHLLSANFQSIQRRPGDPYEQEMMPDGMAKIGRVIVRARGLEALKPGFIEVELIPIVAQVFLEESLEWKRWLLTCAEKTQAFMLYTHVNYERFHIRWHRNKPVQLEVHNYDDMPDAETALEASKALIAAVHEY